MPGAGAQSRSATPTVDIVEIPGVIDRPLARYVAEELADAERRGSTLVLLQINSAGVVKVSDDVSPAPPLARRIATATVPVAAWVGPRGATAAGGALFLLEAADIAAASPSARLGSVHPADLANPGRWQTSAERYALGELAGQNGRSLDDLLDLRASRADELLRAIDGRGVQTAAGTTTLRLPDKETLVRFHKPGPLRRALHTLANPALVYVLLLAGAMLLVFELFQPGFGVAGVSAVLLLSAAAHGLTVLPMRGLGLALVILGLVLLALDVAVHGLGVPTALGTVGLVAGSLMLFPGAAGELRIPAWLVLVAALASLVFFVPVMTMAVRAQTPVEERASRRLVGEEGEVRSVLNPEGFVWVDENVWRARSQEGERIRAGERIVVVEVEGGLLKVRRA